MYVVELNIDQLSNLNANLLSYKRTIYLSE